MLGLGHYATHSVELVLLMGETSASVTLEDLYA